jgi:hypothetical protein
MNRQVATLSARPGVPAPVRRRGVDQSPASNAESENLPGSVGPSLEMFS